VTSLIECPDCKGPLARIIGKVDPRGGHTFQSACGHVIPPDLARAAADAGRPVWIEPVTGAALISAERARQHSEEGYSSEHDEQHATELSWAAWCYLDRVASGKVEDPTPPSMWPWHETYWKPGPTAVRMLVKAGALIAAEIDRRLAKDERP
jgi:hypothetical protein